MVTATVPYRGESVALDRDDRSGLDGDALFTVAIFSMTDDRGAETSVIG